MRLARDSLSANIPGLLGQRVLRLRLDCDFLSAKILGANALAGAAVAAVLGDLYDPFDHFGGPGSRTRPRISTDTLRVPRFLSWLNETRI